MSKELPWKSAINTVLSASSKPLHYNEITECIIASGLRHSVGATPAATVNAQISASIKHDGAGSPYVRVSKGMYIYRNVSESLEIPVVAQESQIDQIEDDEAQAEIVSSFGMFWRRNAIDWKSNPRLLGMQTLAATPVDFSKQLGIYLLYDGREIIYVGRSTDRPLGKRLYEHTLDRMSTRWDRFSWFGLLPVSEDGTLGQMPSTHLSSRVIPSLEAILIEALEPRQNRKRGDDLASVEYIQKKDPEIIKKRMKITLETALNKL